MIETFVYTENEGLREDLPADEWAGLLGEPRHHLWVNLLRPTAEEVSLVSRVFGFHPLSLEDALAPSEHPKLELFPDYLFVLVHGVRPEASSLDFRTRPLGLFLTRRSLVSVHAETSRSIANAIEVVRRQPGRLAEPDGVLHLILDWNVDLYLRVLEAFETELERTDEEVFERADPALLSRILVLKRSVLRLRRISSHQREILSLLSREDTPFIGPRQRLYFRDVYDHMVRVTELAETYRELVWSAQETHLSVTSNRLNDILRVLTLFTTLFIPASFIAGFYGMNFEDLPGLRWRYGYPMALAVIFGVMTATLFFFKKKKWI